MTDRRPRGVSGWDAPPHLVFRVPDRARDDVVLGQAVDVNDPWWSATLTKVGLGDEIPPAPDGRISRAQLFAIGEEATNGPTSSDVVQAMRDAIAYLAEKKVPVDATLRTTQLAADDGAPRIPVGGGPDSTGNANVVNVGKGVTNLDALYPVAYGSSHIQAVSFTDSGVQASTILTYGLATDVSLPTSSDQTRLFSQEKWVDFPFAASDIKAQAVSTRTVTGAAAPAADVAPTAAPPGVGAGAPSDADASGEAAPEVSAAPGGTAQQGAAASSGASPRPAVVRAAPTGSLPRTGGAALWPALAVVVLLAGLLVRRRTHASR